MKLLMLINNLKINLKKILVKFFKILTIKKKIYFIVRVKIIYSLRLIINQFNIIETNKDGIKVKI